MFESLPDRVSIYEVSPRDGLQNEKHIVPTEHKLLLIQSLVGAGLRRIEATSYVSARWVPQLADADQLTADLSRPDHVRFSALCPNTHGLERAIQAGMEEVAVFLSASETHNRRNTNRSIERSLVVFEEVAALALQAGLRVRAYISTVWGCPYEGLVQPEQALHLARKLVSYGCYQVSLGDTIGVGTPKQTRDLCRLFLAEFRPEQLALHLHDTRGTALSNALVGLELGIRDFDCSLGGIGGCPYAPGAAGNLATEDLVYTLHGMGVDTGVHLPALIEASHVAQKLLGRPLPGRVHQAGLPVPRT